MSPGAAAIGMSVDDWNAGFGHLPDGGLRLYSLGIDSVLVKSSYDDDNIYFLVQWSDSTKNDAKGRWTFVSGQWVRNTDDDDKLFMAFDVDFPAFSQLGCAAACHLRERLDDTSDAGVQWRNKMHTNAAGEVADFWTWGAATSNPVGHADDQSFNSVTRIADDGGGFSSSNRVTLSDGGYAPKSMSEDGVNAFAGFDPNSMAPVLWAANDGGLHPAAVAFDGTDASTGAMLPGYVYTPGSGSRADVRAVGFWRNGKWTVEIARARVTADPTDTQFNIP